MAPELIEEFKAIYEREFGHSLSDQEALSRAHEILELFKAVYQPIPVHKEHVYRELEAWYKDRNASTT